MPSDGPKNGKLISVRVQPRQHQIYAEVMEAAGLTVSDGVRAHIQHVVASHDALDLTALEIACTFVWRESAPLHFPEHVGDLRVSVMPIPSLNAEVLARLVFVIPEFFDGNHEPFRIDSFHFQRVSNSRIAISSPRAHRNVLSFRLIDGIWRAGIFNYDPAIDRSVLEERIRREVVGQITKTIACFLLGYLPEMRLLTEEEVTHANSFLMPHMIKDADAWAGLSSTVSLD